MAIRKDPVTRQTMPMAIRMPDALAEAIRAAAHYNRRSINAELVMRLELSFQIEAPPAPDGPVLQGSARPGGAPRVVKLAEGLPAAYTDNPPADRLYALLTRLSLADRAVALRVLQALADGA
jgi:hypothetical protein